MLTNAHLWILLGIVTVVGLLGFYSLMEGWKRTSTMLGWMGHLFILILLLGVVTAAIVLIVPRFVH